MLEIKDYWDARRAEDLCARIGMPEPATRQILPCYAEFDPEPLERDFPLLLDRVTGAKGVAALNGKIDRMAGERSGWLWAAVLLCASSRRRELDAQAGIPEKVTLDTQGAISRFVRDCRTQSGSWGFRGQGWIWRQMSGTIYRIGALEFERFRYCGPRLGEGKNALESGEKLLSVHIPGDALLTRENIADSYRAAKRFFARFMPEWEYRRFYCDSWLLSPVLRQLLPSDSRILGFAGDFEIINFDPEGRSGLGWVFGDEEDPNAFCERTALQRAAKRLVLDGGMIGTAVGILTKERAGGND